MVLITKTTTTTHHKLHSFGESFSGEKLPTKTIIKVHFFSLHKTLGSRPLAAIVTARPTTLKLVVSSPSPSPSPPLSFLTTREVRPMIMVASVAAAAAEKSV